MYMYISLTVFHEIIIVELFLRARGNINFSRVRGQHVKNFERARANLSRVKANIYTDNTVDNHAYCDTKVEVNSEEDNPSFGAKHHLFLQWNSPSC